jgi:hypothetical protein
MSFLSRALTTESKQEGLRLIAAGIEGIGKTTLLASAPKPVFIALEKGYVDVDREKVAIIPMHDATYTDLIELFGELSELVMAGTFEYQSIVVDSLSALERIIHTHVIALDPVSRTNPKLTMLSAHNGYGNAYNVSNTIWQDTLKWLDFFADNGINICCSCHVFTNLERDTISATEFHFTDALLHSPKSSKSFGSRELVTQWCDIFGMLYTSKTPVGMGSGMNTADIDREQGVTLGVVQNARFRSKNRFGLERDITITKNDGWNCIAKAIYDSKGSDYFSK